MEEEREVAGEIMEEILMVAEDEAEMGLVGKSKVAAA